MNIGRISATADGFARTVEVNTYTNLYAPTILIEIMVTGHSLHDPTDASESQAYMDLTIEQASELITFLTQAIVSRPD